MWVWCYKEENLTMCTVLVDVPCNNVVCLYIRTLSMLQSVSICFLTPPPPQ